MLPLFFVLFSLFEISHAETRILILGDSLTEGYGIAPDSSYPAVLQNLLKENRKTGVEVIPAGVSGSTSASGPGRLKWFLKNPPHILVLELGANDFLRGINPQETKKNLKNTIQLAKEKKVKILLAGMKVPPNYGKEYTKSFEKIFTEIAKEEKVALIPFLLAGVGGIASLNLPDGVHPNEKGHAIMARTVYKYLEPLL
jgi:acyl-CoA thioesterase I